VDAKNKKGRVGQPKKKTSRKPAHDSTGKKHGGGTMDNELRVEKVRELKEAVRNGTYRIDPHKVAEKMIFELWDDLSKIDRK